MYLLIVFHSTPGLCEWTFLQTNYTVAISELANPGSELLQVQCEVRGGEPSQQHTIEIILLIILTTYKH